MNPPFPDTAPLPPAGTSQIWTYRAVYILNDERVGQWSASVRIAVIGM